MLFVSDATDTRNNSLNRASSVIEDALINDTFTDLNDLIVRRNDLLQTRFVDQESQAAFPQIYKKNFEKLPLSISDQYKS
jgi:hypothetical protein